MTFESIKDSWFMKLFKKKTDKSHPCESYGRVAGRSVHLVKKARSIGMMTDMLSGYVRLVQLGEKAIVIGKDFVVMSRKEYDELVRKAT